MNEFEPDERFGAAARTALVDMVDAASAPRRAVGTRRMHALQAVVAVAVVALVVSLSAAVLAHGTGSPIGGTPADSPIPSPRTVHCSGGRVDAIEPFGCDDYISTEGHDAHGDVAWLRTYPLHVRFFDGRGGLAIGVESTCNGFGAGIALTTTGISLTDHDVAETGVACADDHVSDAATFFTRPVSWTLAGDRLVLVSGGTTIDLLRASAALPLQRVSCTGHADRIQPFGCGDWVSTDGTDAHGEVAWLRTSPLRVDFGAEGRDPRIGVTGGGVCPAFGATIALTMSDFRVLQGDVTGELCASDPVAAEHTRQVDTFFAHTVNWRLVGDRLTLSSGSTTITLRRTSGP